MSQKDVTLKVFRLAELLDETVFDLYIKFVL